MRAIGLFICLLTFTLSLHGQLTRIDSAKVVLLIDSLNEMTHSDQSLAFARQINALTERTNFQYQQTQIKTWLGDYYEKTGDYDKALQNLQAALTLSKSLQDVELEGVTIGYLGNVYNSTKDFEKAKKFYKEAIRLFEVRNDHLRIGYGLLSLSAVYLGTENPEKGFEMLLKAMESAKLSGSKKLIHAVNSNTAITYVKLNRPAEAIPYFEETLSFYKSKRDTFNFAAGYGNLAYGWQHAGNFDKALLYYDSSLYYSNLLERDEVTYITLLDISDGYAMKGDTENALKYFQQYHNLYKKVLDRETQNKIAELDVKYDTKNKEQSLLANEQAIRALKQESKIRRQRLWLIGLGLLASIVISFLIYIKGRSDLKKNEMQEKLIRSELKNKELEAANLEHQLENKKGDLTNLALDISRKNEFSIQLIEKLEALQKKRPDEIKANLKEVIQYTSNHLQINEDLALLHNNVEQINHEFYQKLDQQFKNLSSNEKYLSGLIRLNLSNKEIASIKGISVNSAKMNRYRLRKKLGLKPEEDIVGFLQSF